MAEMLAARIGRARSKRSRPARVMQARTRWLQSVLDQMPEGILVIDRRGQVIRQNAAFRSIMNAEASGQGGLDPLTIELARPSGERLVPDDLPIHAGPDEWRSDRRTGVRRARRRTIEPVPLLVSAAPVLTQEGLPARCRHDLPGRVDRPRASARAGGVDVHRRARTEAADQRHRAQKLAAAARAALASSSAKASNRSPDPSTTSAAW